MTAPTLRAQVEIARGICKTFEILGRTDEASALAALIGIAEKVGKLGPHALSCAPEHMTGFRCLACHVVGEQPDRIPHGPDCLELDRRELSGEEQ